MLRMKWLNNLYELLNLITLSQALKQFWNILLYLSTLNTWYVKGCIDMCPKAETTIYSSLSPKYVFKKRTFYVLLKIMLSISLLSNYFPYSLPNDFTNEDTMKCVIHNWKMKHYNSLTLNCFANITSRTHNNLMVTYHCHLRYPQ